MFKVTPTYDDYFNMSYDVYENNMIGKTLDHIEILFDEAFILIWLDIIPKEDRGFN